ncbi:cysteine-rich secretory family protein [Lachnoanaerobaculum sp. MSX33]|uniref:CAP domain-containing protein n=1 Tax=Lachnoanaerobaculum sp. MSX33 TaxID=936596 RepID=UPI0003DFA3ED|nr:CAP domain-containing protein [Lachnoanaerobaculum sp. MSX33]ETO98694.1 cysteine-rich secretory family protein [Lachnoanaerobaculum sp. MSX33]
MNLFKRLMCSVSAVAVSAFLVIPVMAANEAQWKRNDKGWWYEEADGSYPTNAWKLIKDKWYYFDGIGYMVENRWIGNYYLGADGAMLVNTSTPDGYYVDATGKWVEGVGNTVNISKTSGSGTKRSSLGGGSSRSGGSGGSGGSRRSGGGSSGSGGSSRRGGDSSGSGSGYSSGSGVGTAGSTGNTTASNNTAGNNNNTTPSVNNNVTVPSGNNTVVIPSGNTGNNTVTIPNTTTPAVSTQETQVIEALKAMGLTEKEAKLYYKINAYRESLGLPKLSFSKSLTEVARAHVRDSNTYTPENQVDSRGIKGNLHSWSANGSWTPVVYTSDHHYMYDMWSKPREITNYTGNGYEISAKYSGMISPETALNLWKNSPGHNQVMSTQGMWSDLKTMGVSIDGGYAHVWFGSDADPDGYYDVANYDVIHP